jgi:hypothetical protein
MGLAEWGAFAFGVVLGWFVYFTNRYRKGEVQLSDLTTLLGVIGGGAITALFGDAKTALFGAYGIGLAVGFFAYFFTLIVLVNLSSGAFAVTWFLDGRRRKLADNEEIPGEVRPTFTPMDVNLGGMQQSMPAPAAIARSPLSTAVDERDREIAAIIDALRELMRLIGETTDNAKVKLMQERHNQLTKKLDELMAIRLKDVLDSEAVRTALAKLTGITSDLVAGAKEMKTAADAIATAAKMIELATKAIGFLGAIFA